MKLNEFKNDVEITLKNCNAVYEKRLIHGKVLLCITRPRFEKVSDLNIILSDSWELVEPTYRTRDAFAILLKGGTMISCLKKAVWFNSNGSLSCSISAEEANGLWTKYKEEK